MTQNPSEIFKVLGAETRVAIIEVLKSEKAVGATRIAEILGITPAAVSQHLKILNQAGLVKKERKGYWIPYSIDEKALENCRCLVSRVCTCEYKRLNRFSRRQMDQVTLSSLIEYEQELKIELDNVREKIVEIKRKTE
jgi:DNA-binding transcriptional ArsR family regulator